MFHNMLKTRRNMNRIFLVKDSEGKIETSAEGIATTFIEFYKDLLGTSTSNTVRVNSCLVREGNILKDDHRSMLEREFKSE